MNRINLTVERKPAMSEWIVVLIWFALCATGIGWLVAYDNSPARAIDDTVANASNTAMESKNARLAAYAQPPQWPAETAIPKAEKGPTLVVFIHPQCPCTRASLTELEKLVTSAAVVFAERGELPLEPRIVSFVPSQPVLHWSPNDLRARAAEIPNALLYDDTDGREATRFGAAASGHTMLYDANGKLLFSGGVTLSRGHEGDNPGANALLALLTNDASYCEATAVFGCPIVTAEATPP